MTAHDGFIELEIRLIDEAGRPRYRAVVEVDHDDEVRLRPGPHHVHLVGADAHDHAGQIPDLPTDEEEAIAIKRDEKRRLDDVSLDSPDEKPLESQRRLFDDDVVEEIIAKLHRAKGYRSVGLI